MSPRGMFVLAIASLAIASPARAQSVLRATVVRLEAEDVFLDLAPDAARAGLVLELYRHVEVRHPRTGRVLRDRFRIGQLEITAPGEVLSIARPRGAMSRNVAIGDEAEVEIVRPPVRGDREEGAADPEPEVAVAVCPEPAVAVLDARTPDEQALDEVFASLLGRSPEERALAYRAFVLHHPRSPYREEVEREAVAMERLARWIVEIRRPAIDDGAGVAADPLEEAPAGVDRDVAVVVRGGARIHALRLQHRVQGETAYHAVTMRPDGPGYARATIPGAEVRAPALEYFVEAIDERGDAHEVLGEARRPIRAVVRDDPAVDPTPRARVRIATEYVGFDNVAPRLPNRDWSFQGEIDVLYRVLYGFFHGVRLGYGALGGQGAALAILDAMPGTRDVGFAYGYMELEARWHPLFSTIARGTVGLGTPIDPTTQTNTITGGAQVRIRIGEERGTHLLLAGELMPEIGQRAYVALAWALHPEWPTRAEVHVTDQPVRSDLGVRIGLEQGFCWSDWLTIAVRLSYQGRRIDHTGLGAGIALTFDW